MITMYVGIGCIVVSLVLFFTSLNTIVDVKMDRIKAKTNNSSPKGSKIPLKTVAVYIWHYSAYLFLGIGLTIIFSLLIFPLVF